MRILIAVIIAIFAVVGFAYIVTEGDMEQAGNTVEDAAENVQEGTENAYNSAAEGVDDAVAVQVS